MPQKTPKLGRKIKHRQMLWRNLATSLIIYEKITTTAAKAKLVKPKVESLLAKVAASKEKVALKRYLSSILLNKKAVNKILEVYQPKMEKSTGFVRSYKLGERKGDNAPMILLAIDQKLTEIKPIKKEEPAATKEITEEKNEKAN